MGESFRRAGMTLFSAVLLGLIATKEVRAQIGDAIPRATYYLATQALYAGEYRDAERGLRLETRRGVRTAQARWIDAICYHTMLGEVLYHQGRNAEALAEFDQACQVLLAYPNWLLQVQFQQPPRPDLARARRAPPWGRSERNFTLGQFPDTEQVFVGELNPQRTLQEGGVFRTPMLWRVNVAEVVRATALAIRRRGELLGPLAEHDPLANEISDTLARGNLSPPNHWSIVWIDLLRGVSQAALGKREEADMLLGRALAVDGQFDHPLTCVALLEQGRLAMAGGDSRRAAQLLAEAGFSAYYYENWYALTESVWLGWVNHLAMNAPGVYPPLEPVVAWAQLNRLQHIASKMRLAHAESLLWLGQVDAAEAVLDEAMRRIGETRRGLAGIHLLYVQANLELMRGQFAPGGETLAQAIVAQAGVSRRNFQIGRTSEMYDARVISPRVAVDLYGSLLADPATADWLLSPLDAMAVLQTPHDVSFDRWFFGALERKDAALALEVAEKAKRRRYLASLPLGGRLLALRTLLESPPNELARDAVLQRQQILTSFPTYQQLLDAAAQMVDALRAGPILPTGPEETKTAHARFDAWGKNASQREQMLMQLGPRRLPASFEFPPLHSTEQLQKSLAEGEALVVFHSAAGNLHGFLVSRAGIHHWQLGNTRRLHSGVGEFLRALGNYGPTRSLTADELESERWRKMAAEAYTAVFADARLDLANTKSLVIVPDGLLWYLPFEALVPDAAEPSRVLADWFPLRYGPTAALATRSAHPLRRPQHTGIVANEEKPGVNEEVAGEMIAELEKVVAGPVRLPTPLPELPHLVVPLIDTLIVLDDLEEDSMSLVGGIPLPRGRGSADSAVGLPADGPQRLIVTGMATAAEQGLRGSRRGSARGAAAGSELFQSVCHVMASGGRTILLSRWRTGGRTNLELVREFARELPQRTATEAWQRACILAREAPLDAPNEPRLKGLEATADLPTADHPFFWAGYLLVDTGPLLEEKSDSKEPAAGSLETPEKSETDTPATDEAKGGAAPTNAAQEMPTLPPPNPPDSDE